MKKTFLFLTILFLLSACTPGGESSQATSAAPATETALPEPAMTSTVTPTPEPTAIPTLGIGSTRVSDVDGMVLVYVPAGEFLMGTSDDEMASILAANSQAAQSWFAGEQPQHTVYLDAFWIARSEVTNAMFSQFAAQTGYMTDAESAGEAEVYSGGDGRILSGASWQHPGGASTDLTGLESHPVTLVSWNDAAAYCEWAGRRLPSEAEWEKAARGTEGGIYPWGDGNVAGDLLNFADASAALPWSDNSIDDGYATTAPVGSYPAGASPYGALDMAGNVWEWVSDWYGEAYYEISPYENPGGPASGDQHIFHGGSWLNDVGTLHPADRGTSTSDYLNIFGFRCAESAAP